jgi:hypothetical protein
MEMKTGMEIRSWCSGGQKLDRLILLDAGMRHALLCCDGPTYTCLRWMGSDFTNMMYLGMNKATSSMYCYFFCVHVSAELLMLPRNGQTIFDSILYRLMSKSLVYLVLR